MLFRLNIECFTLKNIYVGVIICIQRHTKEFQSITINGRKYLKGHFDMLIYSIKCSEINITHSGVQKHICYKNGVIRFNFS